MTKDEALKKIFHELDQIIDQFANVYGMNRDKAASLARVALMSGPVVDKFREEFEVLFKKESKQD